MKKNSFVIISVLLIFTAVFFSAEAEEKPEKSNIINSVVKVYTVQSSPNYYQPWQNYQTNTSTGSGLLIENKKILTNAHVVANQSFIRVRKQGDPKKYIAKLLLAGHECDLAVIKVIDDAFYNNMQPLELGGMPELQDTVNVYGYPTGGDNISITEGVVSRIEPKIYSHSGRSLLAIQIDAAINPGNSGGPVFKDGEVIGMAFQGNFNAENMGFIIPSSVIQHFLKDIKNQKYDGFPDIDMTISHMENPDLRKWAKMNEEQTGVMISHLPYEEKRKGFFKEDDVILEISGKKIANDGTVKFNEDDVVSFGHEIWKKFIGETCRFKILRKGQKKIINYKLGTNNPLVPQRKFDKIPKYYIIGGMLFVPLTTNYIDSWRSWKDAPRELTFIAEKGEKTKEKQEVVVLSEVLADNCNIGYQYIKYRAVKTLDNKTIKDFETFVEHIENSDSKFLQLGLENNQKIVLELNKIKKATPRILKRYRIPSDRSKNLVK